MSTPINQNQAAFDTNTDPAIDKKDGLNQTQIQASDPSASVWVNASAGTGKTKVLTDRVLRLLLPRENGARGTQPHRILCLTYTKAAAAEMALRLNKTLSGWAVMEQADLIDSLYTLTGKKPEPIMLQEARKLFVKVLDSPGGLKIQTIHAFCQSLLGRFPIEAGLPPGFKVIEDGISETLMAQARTTTLSKFNADPTLQDTIRDIATQVNEQDFTKLMDQICGERGQLKRLLAPFRNQRSGDLNRSTLLTALLNTADAPNQTKEDLIQAYCATDPRHIGAIISALQTGTKTDQKIADGLKNWLTLPLQKRMLDIDVFKSVFLTNDDKIRSLGKRVLQTYPALQDHYNTLCQDYLQMQEACKAIDIAALSAGLLQVGWHILHHYQTLKSKMGVLDYEDLIEKTLGLLNGDNAHGVPPAWVLYKLDGGLDHILIDEAQDTNPEQWAIIDAIIDEFCSGSGQNEENRTLFVVGDEKQSIYSFQRAAPALFDLKRQDFARKFIESGKKWRELDMITSYRSTKSVLALVDSVFAPDHARRGLGTKKPYHVAYRSEAAGHAELWPVEVPKEDQSLAPWDPPTTIINQDSATQITATRIAAQIRQWLDDGSILESAGRPIHPGDILILVRTRKAFVGQMVKALKSLSIPVSGVDRLILNQSIAVQDLLCAARFALLPDDDLTLASFLKSPFIGWDDDDLFGLAAEREHSLWQKLQKKTDQQDLLPYARGLIKLASQTDPYGFMSYLLHHPCPANSQSGLKALLTRLGEDSLDPIQELLSLAIQKNMQAPITLQKFIHEVEQQAVEIKRELEEAGKAVRIMTVHGAKGLQAPIVFMPDTTRTKGSVKTDSLLWPDKSKLSLPLWSPRKDMHCKAYVRGQENVQATQDDEYRRLLYVALTRAADRLYITGHAGKKGYGDDSWHSAIKNGFERLDTVQKDGKTLIISNPQTIEVIANTAQQEHARPATSPTIDWLYQPMPDEQTPPRPLRPSRPSGSELEVSLSPLLSRQNNKHRYHRGNVLHALLQFAPDIKPESRKSVMAGYLKQPGINIDLEEHDQILNEIETILTDPHFAPIFGPGSRAEVPVSGLLDNNTLISGQIDRLLITKDQILIVDYKTNRPPPDNANDIPVQYRNQLKAYARTLEKIYPNRKIKTALLWTNIPRLMPVVV